MLAHFIAKPVTCAQIIKSSPRLKLEHMFSVSDRICVSGDLGTVRYVGPLPIWGSETTAYGIEWDNPERGKNSGAVGGVQYFSTTHPGGGSFVKATSSKVEPAVSFYDAVFSRYAGAGNAQALQDVVRFGAKVAESYGFEKLNDIQKDFSKLRVVMVDRQNIKFAGTPSTACPAGVPLLPSAEALDISANLLTSWKEVTKIIEATPNVVSLNLNGNKMQAESLNELPSRSFAEMFPRSLRDVALAATNISYNELNAICQLDLRRLELAFNGLGTRSFNWSFPATLEILDLSYNLLSTIPAELSMSAVRNLTVSHNQIGCFKKLPCFEKVHALDLRNNPVTSFELIELISDKFPALRELRIDHCPVFDGLSAEEMAIQLIGRVNCVPKESQLPGIFKLNGSLLSASEIHNAELYFIAKVRSGDWSISNQIRWHTLLEKHKMTESPASSISKLPTTVCLSVRQASDPEKELFSRVFLQSNSVLKLKGTIARHIGTSVLNFRLFYLNDSIDTCEQSREYLDDDIANLYSVGLSNNHKIFIGGYTSHPTSRALVEMPQPITQIMQ